MASTLAQSTRPTAASGTTRKRRIRAADEAVLTLTKSVANRQAVISWKCACAGLIPVLGLPLGLAALFFAWLGLRRFRRRPEDLGIRHAVGGLILGSIEILVNLAGLGCILIGALELAHSS